MSLKGSKPLRTFSQRRGFSGSMRSRGCLLQIKSWWIRLLPRHRWIGTVDRVRINITGRWMRSINWMKKSLNGPSGSTVSFWWVCTQLQVQADDLLQKAKYSRFRTSLDFTDLMDKIIKQDNALVLKNMVEPLFGLKLHKTLNLHKLDDMLSFKPDEGGGQGSPDRRQGANVHL